MSVRVDGDVIHLAGRCRAEDAELLIVALQEHPGAAIDLSATQRLHLAVLQVLLAARPPVLGIPDSEFLAQHVVDLMQ
ncbi:hypothetical protein [Sphingomonas immobilis]|uniref:STAS domain-containing protein n=1 Tax=Sphingomonas immobilis TaxID=3063997 RepID=A0ABT8ZXB7_9SPHN|nr:hypothetical protein [Sphingomonas sp. CA1-15]MDO7841789.1 hypothetical protein [Sphingomonas sp. CA1-15]